MAEVKRPESTPLEKFEGGLRRIFSAPKEEVDKAELRERKAREAGSGQ